MVSRFLVVLSRINLLLEEMLLNEHSLLIVVDVIVPFIVVYVGVCLNLHSRVHLLRQKDKIVRWLQLEYRLVAIVQVYCWHSWHINAVAQALEVVALVAMDIIHVKSPQLFHEIHIIFLAVEGQESVV